MLNGLGKLLVTVPIALAIGAVLLVLLRWLWNRTMPGIGPFRPISFGQAFRLFLLVLLLGLVAGVGFRR